MKASGITGRGPNRAGGGPRTRSLGGIARAGFTLIEIIVTVAIVGLMLASVTQVLTMVRLSRDSIHNIQEVQLAGPAIMDLIERDLRALVTNNRPSANHLRITNRVLLGEDSDRIDFVCATDSLVPNLDEEEPARADVNEVGYCLRINADDDRFLEMYRREGFGVDEEVFDGGTYTFLHDRVRSFDIEIYEADGPDEEPIEEWGMDSTDPETQGLPASIKITLTLELAPRLLREALTIARVDKQVVTFTRVLRMPEGMRVPEEQVPRVNVPLPPEETADPLGGPGEGGEETPETPPTGTAPPRGNDRPRDTQGPAGDRPPPRSAADALARDGPYPRRWPVSATMARIRELCPELAPRRSARRGWRWYARDAEAERAVDRYEAFHLGRAPEGVSETVLDRKPGKVLAVLAGGTGGVFCKGFHLDGGGVVRETLRLSGDRLGHKGAVAEAAHSLLAARHAAPVPRFHALGERTRLGIVTDQVLLFEALLEHRSLAGALADGQSDPTRRRADLGRGLDLLVGLDAAGLAHLDANAKNIMLSERGAEGDRLVDLEQVVLVEPGRPDVLGFVFGFVYQLGVRDSVPREDYDEVAVPRLARALGVPHPPELALRTYRYFQKRPLPRRARLRLARAGIEATPELLAAVRRSKLAGLSKVGR